MSNEITPAAWTKLAARIYGRTFTVTTRTLYGALRTVEASIRIDGREGYYAATWARAANAQQTLTPSLTKW